MKFTPPPYHREEWDIYDDDGHLIATVWNTGIKMEKDLPDELFIPVEEATANMILFLRAPDLVISLKEFLSEGTKKSLSRINEILDELKEKTDG